MWLAEERRLIHTYGFVSEARYEDVAVSLCRKRKRKHRQPFMHYAISQKSVIFTQMDLQILDLELVTATMLGQTTTPRGVCLDELISDLEQELSKPAELSAFRCTRTERWHTYLFGRLAQHQVLVDMPRDL